MQADSSPSDFTSVKYVCLRPLTSMHVHQLALSTTTTQPPMLSSVPAVLRLQVCCQPAFAAVEDSLLRRQCCSCAGKSASPASSGQNRTPLWAVSLVFRCAYVGLTTLVAVALPFFAIMVGLAAALTFYQTAVLYPLLLHKAVYPRERLGTLLLNVVLVLAAAVTGLVVVGSVAIIAVSASSLSPLKAL